MHDLLGHFYELDSNLNNYCTLPHVKMHVFDIFSRKTLISSYLSLKSIGFIYIGFLIISNLFRGCYGELLSQSLGTVGKVHDLTKFSSWAQAP